MTTLFIAATLLILFLILDRIQNILKRRSQAVQDEKTAKLDVLKIITKQELHGKAEPESFHQWISRLLKMMGYTEIKANIFDEDSGYDFSCAEKGRKVYVVCKLWQIDRFEEPVKLTTVQKLIGAMVGGRVKKGLIITAGELTDEARQYIDALPVSYRITVWDGEKLMEKLYDLRKVKLEPLFVP